MNKTITSLKDLYRQVRKQYDGPSMTVSAKIYCSNQQPPNSVARKPQRYISDTVSVVCLLCVLTTLHGSRPPRDASPLPLHYQQGSVELPWQKREKDMSTERFAHKLSAKSNHMASSDFQKLRRCKPLICSEIKKRVLLGSKNASYNDRAGDRVWQGTGAL